MRHSWQFKGDRCDSAFRVERDTAATPEKTQDFEKTCCDTCSATGSPHMCATMKSGYFRGRVPESNMKKNDQALQPENVAHIFCVLGIQCPSFSLQFHRAFCLQLISQTFHYRDSFVIQRISTWRRSFGMTFLAGV